MKLLSRLIIALVVCLIAIPMMATPVQAHPGFSISGESISPDGGYVGDEIRIYGSWDEIHGGYIYIYYELYNVAEDDWDYKRVHYEEHDTEAEEYDFDYDFEIPESCMGAHDILICDNDDPDDDVDTLEFTVYPLIEIDEDEGPAGTEVGVTGTGWNEDESEIEIRFYLKDPGTAHLDDEDYYFEVPAQDIEVDDYGSWEDVIFEVPPSSKGDHWIYAVGDEADDIEADEIRGVEFEVLPGISLDLKEGRVGKTITVTGSGFEEYEEDIEILFDDETVETVPKDIKAKKDGCWTGTFEVPEAAKGKHDVTAEGEDTDKEDIEEVEFEIVPGLMLEPTEGTEGYVGTDISVSGRGFAKSKTVTVTYGGETYSSTTDTKGSFPTVTFKAKGKHGEQPIKVSDAAGNTVTATFLMESLPPVKPALTTPANGSRVGFVGKVAPTFEWSVVTDPSGVTYNLQVSSEANFAILAIPEVSGLTQTSYVVASQQALSYGTYYWRVKAIDGAQNDSGWTTAYSFKSSLLPLWAFIVIIVLIVVLIGALVYFFVIRGRAYYE